jgi:serine/threonine protein kinase
MDMLTLPALQIASALRHIHAIGLAHLDLKPENIYRSSGGLNRGALFPASQAAAGANGPTPRSSSTNTAIGQPIPQQPVCGSHAESSTTMGPAAMGWCGAGCSEAAADQAPLQRTQSNAAASSSDGGTLSGRSTPTGRQQRGGSGRGKGGGGSAMGSLNLVPSNGLQAASAAAGALWGQQGPWVYKVGDFGRATLKDGTGGVQEGDAR